MFATIFRTCIKPCMSLHDINRAYMTFLVGVLYIAFKIWSQGLQCLQR